MCLVILRFVRSFEESEGIDEATTNVVSWRRRKVVTFITFSVVCYALKACRLLCFVEGLVDLLDFEVELGGVFKIWNFGL